ncbi:hypothetical protein KY290_001620 [Solanum tuberosum]|uniref:Uncharacterized protein n=1 Tax=Solanum tuberosum TaxID=4113 RepID=A0ABQ7WMN8_SOLTU|nr:hypothetical protein KY284_001656 [Solanum tuberosum]KAH0782022.1 hypothetical protein KY290_001620 [Solanum tuberosum]
MDKIVWKDVNEGILRSTPMSTDILTCILNLDRINDVTYKHNQDGYTHPEKVQYILQLMSRKEVPNFENLRDWQEL